MLEKLELLNEQLAELNGIVSLLANVSLQDTDEEYFQKALPGSLQHIKKELERLHSEYYDLEYEVKKNIG